MPLPLGDSEPNLIHGSLLPRVTHPNDISIGSAVFTGLGGRKNFTGKWEELVFDARSDSEVVERA